MSLQTVSDLSDAVALESNLGLYLKPVSRIKINVQLPKNNLPGQSISSFHAMEKLKETVRPDTFIYIKTLKITPAVIKFEGELETKATCERALARLRAAGSLKISGFQDKLQVRAAHGTATGPTRHDWEAFFRDAKGVNEMKPGERPDTVHLKELPVKWFAEKGQGKGDKGPNEKLVRLAFGTFGKIRRLEVPTIRTETAIGNSMGLQKDSLFEVYIQYEEFVEFSIAMDALRGKKLLYKDPGGKVYSADIKVDFDRTKYLSEACIKKREAEEKKINPVAVKAEEITKNTSSSTSQAKQSSHAPVKKIAPSEETKVTSPLKDSKSKVKNAKQTPEDKKRAQLEARFLLQELLLRAEKSERNKEEAKEIQAKLKGPVSQKRPKEFTPIETLPKTAKTVAEKNYKELKGFKIKHSKIKLAEIDLDRKELKVEKQTNSKTGEKRIKIDKEGHSKVTSVSMHEKRTSKSIEGRYKEKKVLADCDKAYKGKTSKYEKTRGTEKEEWVQFNKDYEIASNGRKNKDKRTYSDCDKTHHEKKHKLEDCDKTHEKKHKLEDCDKTHEKKHKQEDCDKTKDNSKVKKPRELHVENKEQEDEQKRMFLEEKKLKERLIQSYNQNKRNKERLLAQERILKEKLLRNLRAREEEKLKTERERLRRELAGRKVLKSVLADSSCSVSKRR